MEGEGEKWRKKQEVFLTANAGLALIRADHASIPVLLSQQRKTVKSADTKRSFLLKKVSLAFLFPSIQWALAVAMFLSLKME